MKPFPQTHRDVEHLRAELEALESLIQVCADSVKYCAAPELSAAANVLQMAADRAFEAVEHAKKLEQVLLAAQEQEDAA